jgi:hypothetical protein
MKLLPIGNCCQCYFTSLYKLDNICNHHKIIEKYPSPKDRPIGIPFRDDCPLEDAK